MFVLPIIIALAVRYVNMTYTNVKISVIDNDNTKVTQLLKKNLSNSFDVVPIENNDIEDSLSIGSCQYVLVINKGFSKAIEEDKNPSTTAYFDKNSNVHTIVTHNVNDFIEELLYFEKKGKLNYEEIIKTSSSINYVDLEKKEISDSRVAINFLLMLMLITSINFSEILLVDKEEKGDLRSFAAPIRISSYMFQCILNLFLLSEAQVSILLIFLAIIYKSTIIAYLPLLFIMLSFFSLLSVSISIFFNTISSKTKRSGLYNSIAIIPMCMLGGCFWDISIMPASLQYFSQFIPISWTVNGVLKILYYRQGFMGIGINLIISLLFSAVFFLLGIFTKKDIVK
jgi:ABC-2 type transport system permease protein